MTGVAALAVAATLLAGAAPDVYVLAGQSNMSGRGAIAGLPAEDRVADPRIRLYGNDGQWRAALDPLDDGSGQVDAVSADKQAAVGPGLTFARALLHKRQRPIALVPCAKGGTAIGRWKPASDRTTLYGSCVARVREAGGHLAGMLWYQGESDAEKPLIEAQGWTTAFQQMATGFAATSLHRTCRSLSSRSRTRRARIPVATQAGTSSRISSLGHLFRALRSSARADCRAIPTTCT